MTYQTLQELAASHRADLITYIEQARLGQLPPSRQEACFEDIEPLKGTLAYPEDGDTLFRQLREILRCTPQITQQDYEAAEVSAIGGRLLCFCYLDRYTLLELSQQPGGSGYDACAFLCAEKHRHQLSRTASAMQAALDTWVAQCGLPHRPIEAARHPNASELCRCDTLDEALAFLYTCLQFPESILT